MRSINELYEISKAKNWRLNPDDKIVKMILEKENKDFELLKNYYCPCKRQKTKENVCPCENAQNEINQDGHCHCLLYWDNNPMVVQIGFFDITENEHITDTFEGDKYRIEIRFLDTKEVKEIDFIIVNGRLIRLIQYKGQWYMTEEPTVLYFILKQINESSNSISKISDIHINIIGDTSKGYAKKVNEILIQLGLGGEMNDTNK